MNISDYIVTLAQTAEVEKPNLFPFPFNTHLIFCCLAIVFFAILFSREKKPYQLIMGIAIPFSLVIWLSDSRTLFYAVGIIELILLLAAFITSIIFKDKKTDSKAVSKDETSGESAPDTGDDVSDEE